MPAQAGSDTLKDTELEGGTYRSFELVAPVPDFCRKVCDRDEGCQAWTFSWPGKKGKRAMCFLKRTVTARRQDTCCISGYRKNGLSDSLQQLARRWLGHNGEAGSDAGNDASATDSGSATPSPSPPASTAPAPAPADAAGSRSAPDADVAQVTPQPDVDEVALARKRQFCRDYARQAVQANRQARRLGCGFGGGLWGASYNGYFNWCIKNPPQSAERNTLRRAQALQRCEVAARQAPYGQADAFPPYSPYPPARDIQPPYDRQPPAARALRQRAPWLYSWLKRSGPGPRTTPWRPSLSGKCPQVRACDCPQGNTCRVYAPGEIAVSWPQGCYGPPVYRVCRVRRR